MINILHLTDLHFGATNPHYSHAELFRHLNLFLDEMKDGEVFVIVSGDVTLKGNPEGYQLALEEFEPLLRNRIISRDRLLFCPGNHDIEHTRPEDRKAGRVPGFTHFDGFVYSLLNDKVFGFDDKGVFRVETSDTLFLLINSAQHLEHSHGLVDLEEVNRELENDRRPHEFKTKVAVLHHHLVNQYETDISAVRNGYHLIHLLDRHKFDLILHGHQHSDQNLAIGASKIGIFGARSAGFDTRGYDNGFNIYKIEPNLITATPYHFVKDIPGPFGRKGKFVHLEPVKIER